MQKNARKHRGRLRKEGRLVTPGSAPGTLTADPNAHQTTLHYFAYNPEPEPTDLVEGTLENLSSLPALLKKWPTVWINVVGLKDLPLIEQLGEHFNLHRLALEDVMNVRQRPKVEEYDRNLFIVSRYQTHQPALHSEQISLFLGEGFVLSFQEEPGDCFDGVRGRLRKGKGRIRSSANYLVYALLDSTVDHNFPLLETYGEQLETLEEEVIEHPGKSTIAQIYGIKRDLIALRRAVWPMRELVNTLMREETPHFTKETHLFLRDCHDHVVQVIDLTENYREISSGLVDVYLSSISNRMNDVMRVLTLIATIFMPLSFIVGLYGMNFSHDVSPWNMPELTWRFGYPFALLTMVAMVSGMMIYFKKKGWL